jgi:hypothetical protein
MAKRVLGMIRRRISEDSGKKLSEGPKGAVPPGMYRSSQTGRLWEKVDR